MMSKLEYGLHLGRLDAARSARFLGRWGSGYFGPTLLQLVFGVLILGSLAMLGIAFGKVLWLSLAPDEPAPPPAAEPRGAYVFVYGPHGTRPAKFSAEFTRQVNDLAARGYRIVHYTGDSDAWVAVMFNPDIAAKTVILDVPRSAIAESPGK